jgi:predicted porin
MKKSLIALAVLGAFAGVASAQSSVTIYGVADVNLQRTDPKAGTVSDASATTGINGGHLAGNRFGVRGTEDLGGGLKAIFTLENGYNIDTGTLGQGGRLFGRQGWVGLQGGFGTLVAGRIASFSSGTGSFDKFGSLDPFRTGYGIIGFGSTFTSAAALRLDNTIAYATPQLGGFSAGIGTTFRADGSELAGGSGSNNNGIVSYANFSAGPLYGVVTFDRFKLGEVAGDPTRKHIQAGVSYDMKVAKLSAAFGKEDQDNPTSPATADSKSWALGAAMPFGPHRVALSYQKRDVDSTATSAEGDRKVLGLGYEYSLSRRTTFYASYGDLKDDGSLKTATSGGSKQTTVGLFHSF